VQALATHVWRVAGDELRAYKGNYAEYLRQVEAEKALSAGAAVAEVEQPAGPTPSDRERRREERRLRKAAERAAAQAAALEAEAHALELKLATLSSQLEAASLAGDVARVQSLGLSYQAADAELHRVMEAWAELA